ncbi:MAG: TrbI/VirB10 family protein [Hyphomonas sp.]|uniref:TrbI/VirB10 family protein n=1 Tax=Hyphomonas sp. TaxID=87 RepID=UPI00329891DE
MAESKSGLNDIEDDRPVVASEKPSNLGLYVFAVLLAAGGIWIFSLMSAMRTEVEQAGPTLVSPDPAVRISSPPPLALPASFREPIAEDQRPAVRPERSAQVVNAPIIAPPPATFVARTPVAAPPPPFIAPAPITAQAPSVVFNETFGPNAAPPNTDERTATERVTAGRLANPSQTIPQGTVIPAVLETALDSTRPGGVRALVQRHISSFDGSQILIQRGSRLYGEYEADLSAGQKRANIRWTRLIRPDGVTIDLDSPASDPLGRAGVKGKVDSKFLQRFGGALLQSVLDIGVGVATREATGGVVVALPGSTQNVRIQETQEIRPTLKVRHGTSVSVFVARDLDFSTVGA